MLMAILSNFHCNTVCPDQCFNKNVAYRNAFELENNGGERAISSSSQLIPMLIACCRATMLNYSSKLLLTSDFSIEGQLGKTNSQRSVHHKTRVVDPDPHGSALV
jgi:hypothetical protein